MRLCIQKEPPLSKSFTLTGSPKPFVFLVAMEDNPAFLDELEKAKYNARYNNNKPPPKYRYIYNIPDKGIVREETLKVGSRFKHGEEGHFIVTHASDSKVTIKHSKTGEVKETSRRNLKSLVHQGSAVKEEIETKGDRLAKEIEQVLKTGTDKQKAKIIRQAIIFTRGHKEAYSENSPNPIIATLGKHYDAIMELGEKMDIKDATIGEGLKVLVGAGMKGRAPDPSSTSGDILKVDKGFTRSLKRVEKFSDKLRGIFDDERLQQGLGYSSLKYEGDAIGEFDAFEKDPLMNPEEAAVSRLMVMGHTAGTWKKMKKDFSLKGLKKGEWSSYCSSNQDLADADLPPVAPTAFLAALKKEKKIKRTFSGTSGEDSAKIALEKEGFLFTEGEPASVKMLAFEIARGKSGGIGLKLPGNRGKLDLVIKTAISRNARVRGTYTPSTHTLAVKKKGEAFAHELFHALDSDLSSFVGDTVIGDYRRTFYASHGAVASQGAEQIQAFCEMIRSTDRHKQQVREFKGPFNNSYGDYHDRPTEVFARWGEQLIAYRSLQAVSKGKTATATRLAKPFNEYASSTRRNARYHDRQSFLALLKVWDSLPAAKIIEDQFSKAISLWFQEVSPVLKIQKSTQGQFLESSGKLPGVHTTMPQEDGRILTLSATPQVSTVDTLENNSTVDTCSTVEKVLKARKLEKRRREHGLAISVETAQGSTRTGKDAHGMQWKTVMPHDYGYIRGTLGLAPDGDHLDLTIGPEKNPVHVWVLHIKDPITGEEDEDKVFLNFKTKEDVIAAFRRSYDHPDRFLNEASDITEYTLKEFLALIKKVIKWKVAETTSHKLDKDGHSAISEKHDEWKDKKNQTFVGSFSLTATPSA